MEQPMDGGAWGAAVHGVAQSRTRLSDFTFPFHFHALEKEMATHSSVLTWRIPGTGEPGGLPSMGSQSRTRLKRLSRSSSSVICQYQTPGLSLCSPLPALVTISSFSKSVSLFEYLILTCLQEPKEMSETIGEKPILVNCLLFSFSSFLMVLESVPSSLSEKGGP